MTTFNIVHFSSKDVVGRLVIQDFWQTRERDFFFLPTGVYRPSKAGENGGSSTQTRVIHPSGRVLQE